MTTWILIGLFAFPDGLVTKIDERMFTTPEACQYAMTAKEYTLIQSGAPADGEGWNLVCMKVTMEGA